MKLLKELHREQVKLLTDSTPIHQRVGDGALDFAAQRDVPALGEREGDLHLRLTEEGIKELDKQPIAAAALGRVGVALEKSAKYLSTPALGERGMRLERIALYELARLIAIVDGMPPPKQSEKKGGGGGQQGTQAPFPPEAELGLLAAMQEEIAALTAADRPVDLAQLQKKEAKLVEALEGASRPGSRPSLLLARARRAMDSAADMLAGGDRGATTRNEQSAAEAALRRMIAEAESGGGGKGKPNPSAAEQTAGRQGSAAPARRRRRERDRPAATPRAPPSPRPRAARAVVPRWSASTRRRPVSNCRRKCASASSRRASSSCRRPRCRSSSATWKCCWRRGSDGAVPLARAIHGHAALPGMRRWRLGGGRARRRRRGHAGQDRRQGPGRAGQAPAAGRQLRQRHGHHRAGGHGAARRRPHARRAVSTTKPAPRR